ncbi:MAG: SIR2 family protein [Devosia sp.]
MADQDPRKEQGQNQSKSDLATRPSMAAPSPGLVDRLNSAWNGHSQGLSKREFFILKAHGDASKLGNDVILTDVDYRNILFRQRGYQSLLSAMFTMFTIVFVGASMTDPEISLLLSYISDAFTPSSGPSHYALMAEEDVTQIERDRWYKDFNIQLLTVSKANNYAELTGFLGALGVAV